MSENEIIYADGFWYNEPSDNAPSFIKANISIVPEKFAAWLQAQPVNEKGYVKITVKESKGGKMYAALDQWKPSGQPQQPAPQQPTQEVSADAMPGTEIPF